MRLLFIVLSCHGITNLSYIQVPRESLLFVIPAFGGIVSWEGEGAPFSEADQSITYQVGHQTFNLYIVEMSFWDNTPRALLFLVADC